MKSRTGLKFRRDQAGQVVVEYVLLLSIGVSIAILVISQLIKTDSTDITNSGALIKKWYNIQNDIGGDQQN